MADVFLVISCVPLITGGSVHRMWATLLTSGMSTTTVTTTTTTLTTRMAFVRDSHISSNHNLRVKGFHMECFIYEKEDITLYKCL